mgnify:FL=1
MTASHPGGAAAPEAVRRADPLVWWNPHRVPAADVLDALPVTRADVQSARDLRARAAPLLAALFPELAGAGGRIDSPLVPLPGGLVEALGGTGAERWFIKADHALPVTGSIKARGGIHEVLGQAVRAARAMGFEGEDLDALAGPEWQARFADHAVLVGSTGNLGYSVGLAARALGFQAEVHLSADAKAWKKDRLRAAGVQVVEHAADYTHAVGAARDKAATLPRAHFVDDETSRELFVGYATAADDLARQLDAAGVVVDGAHPLQVIVPCGVGGAPGGLTLGLKQRWGDAVHCVVVEPVQSPAMLLQLVSGLDRRTSVYEAGLTNDTVADGLACAAASMLAAEVLRPLLTAAVTVSDARMLHWVRRAWATARLRLEPSAAAVFEAALALGRDARGRDATTHVLWTTGGAQLPAEAFEALLGSR